MDTFAIDPIITLVFTVLGGIGSLWIRAHKAFSPAFRIKFDTVFNSEERQAHSLRVGGVLFVIGSVCWLVWLWANGQVPTDPREAVLFAVRTVAQSVINLMGLLGGKTTIYENFKHFLSKPAPVPVITPTLHVSQWQSNPDWVTAKHWPPFPVSGSTSTQSPDSVTMSPATFTGGDNTTTGGGAA